MTDPLIELAIDIAVKRLLADGKYSTEYVAKIADGTYSNAEIVQSALSALRTQKAMIVEWFNRMPCCQEQGGPGCHPARCDTCTRNYADAIEQDEYLKGRG